MNVFDDFLSEKDAGAIQSYMMSEHFPWFYSSEDPSCKYEHVFYLFPSIILCNTSLNFMTESALEFFNALNILFF